MLVVTINGDGKKRSQASEQQARLEELLDAEGARLDRRVEYVGQHRKSKEKSQLRFTW